MFRRALKSTKLIKTQKNFIEANAFKTQIFHDEKTADHICHQIEPLQGKPNVLDKTKNITFIDYTGKKTTVQGYIGQSVLQVAKMNGIPLYGECHGSCGCIGCKVLIVDEFYNDLVGMSTEEEERLDSIDDVHPNCQIVLDDKTPDGLVVSVPPRTYEETVDSWCKN